MKRASFLVCLVLIFGLSGNSVFACSIPTENPTMTATPTPSLEDYSQRASVIFVGAVSAAPTSLISGSVDYQIQVKRYLKGDGSQIVMLENYHNFCADGLEIGQEFIFFAEGDEGGGYIPRYKFLHLVQPSEENRVLAITGELTLPQFMPPDNQLSAIVEKSDMTWLYNFLGILSFFSSLIGFGLWWRKSKSKRGEV
jgi:hypothetical protein